ncbi:nitroreductase family deazaflavin-dependent oxidoreductase [Ktedonospora formicarum]|uniref:Nitroreductase family deazaflavin-dependent oxidoreductase n=1 Tax=Ktedonospora formicarum TaxID=2778364 RepID=A0A8J3I6H1_9CHLR|nr:nitroreductase family deazaflavin-dependent oxidoreductase [Ktedonospora formicarum]GHO47993.1 hypothetical protein KSX_61560 [Ktedonospora formicarum]
MSSSVESNERDAMKKQFDDWNTHNIEEFRANGGKIGGPLEGKSILLLHTIGAKSHQPRINPLGYIQEGDAFVVMASKGGAPTNPDWYHNILAHPETWIEVGTERFKVHATVPEREERDRLYASAVEQAPEFGEYQKNTSRIIPVVVLKKV